MALSTAAVAAAAQVAFMLAGKVLSAVQAVSKAHLAQTRELQLLHQLQGKLHDRSKISKRAQRLHCSYFWNPLQSKEPAIRIKCK